MSENRPFYGKDGGKYRDYYEKEAADNRYDQQQKIIEETRRQNDLLEKQQRESQQQLLQQQMEQERANQLEQEKIELFARNNYIGWDNWGLEIPDSKIEIKTGI